MAAFAGLCGDRRPGGSNARRSRLADRSRRKDGFRGRFDQACKARHIYDANLFSGIGGWEATSLLTIAGLKIDAEKLLGVPVSVLTPNGLPPKFRQEVLQQAQPL